MEAASEILTKRKRGRPSSFSEMEIVLADGIAPEVGPRQRANVIYRQRALRILVNDPGFSWLADGPALRAGKRNAWKPGILSELGRIGDEEAIRIIARELCEKKPLTKAAERAIREWRLGKG
jgi:hypothetical protein